CRRGGWARMCSLGRGFGPGALLDQAVDGLGRQGADADPVVVANAVDLEVLLARIVEAELLDEATIPWAGALGRDDAVEGTLLGALSGEANRNCHGLCLLLAAR